MPYSNPVVIMAGGKGARLRPITKTLPKPLIHFEGKPIVEKIMQNFKGHGFNNFILTLKYKKKDIKSYFLKKRLHYNIGWVEEDRYLGSAGSLGLLKDKIKETFFVCNCDTLLINSDFENILFYHIKKKALLTLVGFRKKLVFSYGVLETDNSYLKSIHEKPKFNMLVNTGFYIFEPEIFSLISLGEHLDMNHLVERAIRRGRVAVYPVSDGWIDLGQCKDHQENTVF